MPIRSFSLFSSSSSIVSGRSSTRSTRPPTYTSYVSASPIYDEPNQLEPQASADHSYEYYGAGRAGVHSIAASSISDVLPLGDSIPRPSGPRFIYYRVFSEDGPIRTVNPVYSHDPYLGRILARLVTPPHITVNLRRCLANAESIDETITTRLFVSCSSQSAMDDAGRVSILAYPGPGCSPNEPMALVAAFPDSFEPPRSDVRIPLPAGVDEGPTPFEPQYIYYQVYKKHGAITSKQPSSASDPYVGHLSVDSIPPPHTAASIMRRISKIEMLEMSTRSQLFTSISSELPFGKEHVSLLTSNRPGSIPEDPIAFVVEPEVPAHISASIPTAVRYPSLSADIRNRFPAFTIPMEALRTVQTRAYDEDNSYWLSYKCGDVLYASRSLPQKALYIYEFQFNGTKQVKQKSFKEAYKCVTQSGIVGFVCASNVKAIEVSRVPEYS